MKIQKMLGLLLTLCVTTAVFSVNAEVYRWVDKDGKVIYSDHEPINAKAEQKKLTQNKVDTSGGSYETRRAAKNAPVTLYTGPSCKELCQNGRDLLTQRKIPFAEKSVVSSEDIDALIKLTGKKEAGVPVLAVGKVVVSGFGTTNWNTTLDSAGYPK